jgi:hypothetical protein
MVPFRDRIAGTHDRRSAGASTDAAVGLGARLRRDVGGARDRHPPRRIRARGAAAYRGDTINSRRLDRLAEVAPQLGMTVATGGRGNVRVRTFTVENLNIRVFRRPPLPERTIQPGRFRDLRAARLRARPDGGSQPADIAGRRPGPDRLGSQTPPRLPRSGTRQNLQ